MSSSVLSILLSIGLSIFGLSVVPNFSIGRLVGIALGSALIASSLIPY